MRSFRDAGLLALIAVLLPIAGPALAQTAPMTGAGDEVVAPALPIIQNIRIIGTNRIEQETVLSYLLVREGDPFDPERLDLSLKALFETGLFADVALVREGLVLAVNVVENPIINRLAFEGNDFLDDETLRSEVQLRPRIVYTRTRVQSDTQRILDIYRASGRFAASVEPKVITLEQNRVDLVFEINEGEVTGIRRINFIGNRAFSDSDLRGVIDTSESAWWRFLSGGDTYDPDRLTFDQELLRRFYLSEGYADYRNVSKIAELTPERDDFFVTFTVEEGVRYRFGVVDVQTSLTDVDMAPLYAAVQTPEGEWYNGDLVEDTITALTEEMGTLGFAFVDIRPQVTRNREAQTVDITFDIDEGPMVFVERINVIGNTRTRDEVVRREMRLAEGDAFNTAHIRQSRRRIERLDFFESVEITNVPGSAPDRTIVNVEVVEKSTGELSLGAGISSRDGPIGTVGLRERNFLGRGQDVGVSFSLSTRTQQLDLSFTEPYFLDRNLSLGVDGFRTRTNFEDEGGFDQQITGFRIRSGYEVAENLAQLWAYELRQVSTKNVDVGSSPIILGAEGANTTSSISQTLSWDTTDSRFDPTEGFFVDVETRLAGFGGSERFFQPKISGGTYYSLTSGIVLSLLGSVGHVQGLGRDVSLADRFFIGQDEVRGFAIAGIGPRDSISDEALGANTFYATTAELSFPLGLPEEFGIRGVVFADMGSAFDLDESGPRILDEATARISAGLGISWRSPFGPVRVDLGVPLVKENFDETEIIRFNFGARF